MSDSTFHSRTFNLPVDNIDTDQIIPAQFLTTTSREGLGKFCFHHWRFEPDGSPREDNPLRHHNPEHQHVLVAGHNFGCGSSREHAPWALLDLGFRAVISSRFADIFRNNSLKNGLLPITVDQEVVDHLLAREDVEVDIDILNGELHVPGLDKIHFHVDPFPAYCLVHGIDQLDFILQNESLISGYEKRHAH